MSKQMLEAAWRGALDRHMLEELDEPWNLQCDAAYHTTPGWEHIHYGAAAFFQKGPCPATTGFRCSRFVRLAQAAQAIECHRCGGTHETSLLVWTPLEAHREH